MKLNLHFKITMGGGAMICATFLFFNQSLHAQKWEKIPPNILYAEDKEKEDKDKEDKDKHKDKSVINVMVGIGTKNPTEQLHVAGTARMCNAKVDN